MSDLRHALLFVIAFKSEHVEVETINITYLKVVCLDMEVLYLYKIFTALNWVRNVFQF